MNHAPLKQTQCNNNKQISTYSTVFMGDVKSANYKIIANLDCTALHNPSHYVDAKSTFQKIIYR